MDGDVAGGIAVAGGVAVVVAVAANIKLLNYISCKTI